MRAPQTTVEQQVAYFECNCGKPFFDQEEMRDHVQDCDEMPHLG